MLELDSQPTETFSESDVEDDEIIKFGRSLAYLFPSCSFTMLSTYVKPLRNNGRQQTFKRARHTGCRKKAAGRLKGTELMQEVLGHTSLGRPGESRWNSLLIDR